MSRLKPFLYPRRKPSQKTLLRIYGALYQHYGPRHWWPGETPFEVMVGAILTQNTAWRNVEKAIQNLKREKLLSPQVLSAISPSRLAELIRPAGYFNIKAKRVKNFIQFLMTRYKGNLKKMFRTPLRKLRRELLEVNGIGEETADSILLYAANKPSFVIDAYTRRVFSRHRYLSGKEDYASLQALFTRLLPKSVRLYNDYHAQIVEVGKDFCRKVSRCDSCPLRNYL